VSRYRIHGLVIESSTIPLDAHSADDAAPGTDYRVIRGGSRPVPDEPPPGELLAEHRRPSRPFWACADARHPSRWTLRYGEVCDVELDRDRGEITTHEAPGTSNEILQLLIEGSVLAHALAANGNLVLHACAVELGGNAVAIAGPSGAGKSTVAALLCGEGAMLVSEDALRCDPIAGGALCYPGARSIRLRQAVQELSDGIPGGIARDSGEGRIAVRPAATSTEPVPLGAIIVPAFSRSVNRLAISEVSGFDRAVELLRYPRLTGWVSPGHIGDMFGPATRLAESVSVYRATLPWGPPFPPALGGELLSAAGLRRAGSRPPGGLLHRAG
jgi:hypothetical protein